MFSVTETQADNAYLDNSQELDAGLGQLAQSASVVLLVPREHHRRGVVALHARWGGW